MVNRILFSNSKYISWTFLLMIVTGNHLSANEKTFAPQTGYQYQPYLEWSIRDLSFEGNPYDLEEKVIFRHHGNSYSITSRMFYAGNDTWKFRFTGMRSGNWSFRTYNPDIDHTEFRGHFSIELWAESLNLKVKAV